MTKEELIEEGFERVDVFSKESGDKDDYYYYNYKLNDHCSLTSNESTFASTNNWCVTCYEIDLFIRDIEDVQLIIELFAKSAKIK
jgi:hypothetical protein